MTQTAVEKRLAIEKRVILRTIDILKKHGFALTGGHDGEERHRFTHAVEAIGMVFSVDESWLYFRHPTQDKNHTIFIVLGNDGWDCLCDYSTGPLWDEAMEEVSAWIDAQWN